MASTFTAENVNEIGGSPSVDILSKLKQSVKKAQVVAVGVASVQAAARQEEPRKASNSFTSAMTTLQGFDERTAAFLEDDDDDDDEEDGIDKDFQELLKQAKQNMQDEIQERGIGKKNFFGGTIGMGGLFGGSSANKSERGPRKSAIEASSDIAEVVPADNSEPSTARPGDEQGEGRESTQEPDEDEDYTEELNATTAESPEQVYKRALEKIAKIKKSGDPQIARVMGLDSTLGSPFTQLQAREIARKVKQCVYQYYEHKGENSDSMNAQEKIALQKKMWRLGNDFDMSN